MRLCHALTATLCRDLLLHVMNRGVSGFGFRERTVLSSRIRTLFAPFRPTPVGREAILNNSCTVRWYVARNKPREKLLSGEKEIVHKQRILEALGAHPSDGPVGTSVSHRVRPPARTPLRTTWQGRGKQRLTGPCRKGRTRTVLAPPRGRFGPPR